MLEHDVLCAFTSDILHFLIAVWRNFFLLV